MEKELKEIIEKITAVLKKIHKPESKFRDRTIFLNKLESEIAELREIYTLRRNHQKL